MKTRNQPLGAVLFNDDVKCFSVNWKDTDENNWWKQLVTEEQNQIN